MSDWDWVVRVQDKGQQVDCFVARFDALTWPIERDKRLRKAIAPRPERTFTVELLSIYHVLPTDTQIVVFRGPLNGVFHRNYQHFRWLA